MEQQDVNMVQAPTAQAAAAATVAGRAREQQQQQQPQQKQQLPNGNTDAEGAEPESWWHSDGSDTSDGEEGAPEGEADDLYDEAADDEDEAWVEASRQGRVSDAILSCPSCFQTLCVDCQRHARIQTQYRAMFCLQGTIELGPPEGGTPVQPQHPSTKRRKQGVSSAEGEVVCPVLCATCGHRVGVRDADEVFHFIDVFPSAA
ncbi:MAG: hypothetical protein WDW36_005611 [Sanguina aurantia]